MSSAPLDGSRVYDPTTSNRGYWSSDRDRTWARTKPLDALAFDPNDASGQHAIGVSREAVWESLDGGATWTRKADLPQPVVANRGLMSNVVWSRQDPRAVFLNGTHAMVFRSEEGSATWTQVLSGGRLPPQVADDVAG